MVSGPKRKKSADFRSRVNLGKQIGSLFKLVQALEDVVTFFVRERRPKEFQSGPDGEFNLGN